MQIGENGATETARNKSHASGINAVTLITTPSINYSLLIYPCFIDPDYILLYLLFVFQLLSYFILALSILICRKYSVLYYSPLVVVRSPLFSSGSSTLSTILYC